MSYEVIWDDSATDELQRVHDEALDKEGVVHAVTRIGIELSQIPLEAGESREGNRRILFKYPLIVWYAVNDRLKTVRVTRVGLWRR